MSSPEHALVIEGMWEEVLSRSTQFVGKRVRITVLPDEAPTTLAVLAREWADEVERIQPQPETEPRGIKGELTRLLSSKFRRQGMKL